MGAPRRTRAPPPICASPRRRHRPARASWPVMRPKPGSLQTCEGKRMARLHRAGDQQMTAIARLARRRCSCAATRAAIQCAREIRSARTRDPQRTHTSVEPRHVLSACCVPCACPHRARRHHDWCWLRAAAHSRRVCRLAASRCSHPPCICTCTCWVCLQRSMIVLLASVACMRGARRMCDSSLIAPWLVLCPPAQ